VNVVTTCSSTTNISSVASYNAPLRLELDSHADTCCAGSNCAVLYSTGREVTVSPFLDKYTSTKGIPIASVNTAYDHPLTGHNYLFILNEALYFGPRMKHSLLCPNQLRSHGVPDSLHSIIVPDEIIHTFPLSMIGVFSFFHSRLPTTDELADSDILRLTLASDMPWHPHSDDFRIAEGHADRSIDSVQRAYTGERLSVASATCCAYTSHLSPEAFSHDALITRLVASVQLAPDYDHAESHTIDKVNTSTQRSIVTKEVLVRRWGLGLDVSQRTLSVTTQSGLRLEGNSLERRMKTKRSHLRFPFLNTRFYTDTMFSSRTSISDCTSAQIFTDGKYNTHVFPHDSKSKAPKALMNFIHDVGIPKDLTSDNSQELGAGRKSRWADIVREFGIRQKFSEPFSPWQNRAESAIRELRKDVRRAMSRSKSPRRLWDYCVQCAAAKGRVTAHSLPSLAGRVSHEILSGHTLDISELIQFVWYEPIWFFDPNASFPYEKKCLGRWIGVAHDVGAPLCSWILSRTGQILARSSVISLSHDDRAMDSTQAILADLDQGINAKLGDHLPDRPTSRTAPSDVIIIPKDIFQVDAEEEAFTADVLDEQDYTPDTYDKYLQAEVLMPIGGERTKGIMTSRKRNSHGNPVGIANNTPLLDTREYELTFPDGSTDTYTANVIAENLYAQVDEYGRSFALLDEIIDHKRIGHAIHADGGFVIVRGQKQPRNTTKGWQLLVQWRDGTSTWVPPKRPEGVQPH
jgi:hypothetical protein